MRRIALTIAALGMLAVPASAQTSPASPSKAPTAAERPGASGSSSSQLNASELKGMSVFSSDGQEIGEVAEMKQGASGSDKVLIKVGQTLGIGERTIEVDKSKLQKSGQRLNLQMTAAEVKNLPDASSSSSSSGSSGSSLPGASGSSGSSGSGGSMGSGSSSGSSSGRM